MILLDTHALVWFISNPENLSKKARQQIEQEIKIGQILISSISVWEIYMLVKKKRLILNIDLDTWVEEIEKLTFLKFIPINNQIASKSVNLPDKFHPDPADRIIVATAMVYGAVIVTSDKKILNYSPIRSIW